MNEWKLGRYFHYLGLLPGQHFRFWNGIFLMKNRLEKIGKVVNFELVKVQKISMVLKCTIFRLYSLNYTRKFSKLNLHKLCTGSQGRLTGILYIWFNCLLGNKNYTFQFDTQLSVFNCHQKCLFKIKFVFSDCHPD